MQFLVYFVYFLVLFGAYLSGAVLVVLRHLRDSHHAPQPPELRSLAEEKVMPMLSVQDGGLSSLQTGAPPLASQEQNQQPEAKA